MILGFLKAGEAKIDGSMLWFIERVRWIIVWEFYKWMCAYINPVAGQGAGINQWRIMKSRESSLAEIGRLKTSQEDGFMIGKYSQSEREWEIKNPQG